MKFMMFSGKLISFFLSFLIILFRNVSCLNFNYEIITYTKEASMNIVLSPEFHDLKKFHHTIQRKITMENGNQILCHIPTFGAVEETELSEEESKLKERRNLTEEESELYLSPLKDVCAIMPTKFFLYEFCYKKYAKQFDDANTMFWGNKPNPEIFYLGKDPDYNGISAASYQEHRIIYNHFMNPFAIVKGRVVKTYGYIFTEKFLSDSLLKITFSLPLSEILHYKDMKITVDGLTYQEAQKITPTLKNNLVNVERVVYSFAFDNHFILEDDMPFDFSTDHYKIARLPKEFEKNRKTQQKIKVIPQFFYYKNYLYISMINGQFMTLLEPYDYIYIPFNETRKNKLVQIKSIISDNLVELTQDSTIYDINSLPIYTYHIISGENHTISWEFGDGMIDIAENVVFGKRTNFLEIEKYDIITVIYENQRYEFFLKEILTNEIMILDTSDLKDFEYYGEFMIGKEIALKKSEDQKNSNYWSHSLKNFANTSLIQSLDIPLSLYFSKPINNKLLCPHTFKLIKTNRALIMFDLRKLIRKNEFSLTMILSEDLCKEQGILISFLTTEKIIISNYLEKDKYVGTGITFENLTISNQTIWIVIDEGVIHLGVSKKIGYKTQLLEFPIRNLTLKYFGFKLQESFNIHLNNIYISDFDQKMEEFLKYFSNHPRKYLKNDNLQYIEYYDHGTECVFPNKRLVRKMVVEYICSEKGSLLEFLEASEPDTCEYRLKVGTYLLCPSSLNSGKISKNFNKIFCHLEN